MKRRRNVQLTKRQIAVLLKVSEPDATTKLSDLDDLYDAREELNLAHARIGRRRTWRY